MSQSQQEEKIDNNIETCKIRVSNALWGLFIGDSLAMPVHWYYNRDNITKQYGKDGITKYEDASTIHPEAFMLGMTYKPDIEKAASLNRKVDFVFKNKVYFSTTLPMNESEKKEHDSLMKALTENEESHGNTVASKNKRIHYHCGLKAGENTLGAQLCRVLLRYIGGLDSKNSQDYKNRDFMQYMIDYLTDSNNDNNDTYCEIYIRRFMENYSKGNDILQLSASQEDIWSIGSMGGISRPLIFGIYYFCRMLTESKKTKNGNKNFNINQCIAMAIKHSNLTHRSENVSNSIISLLPLLCNKFLLNNSKLDKKLINEFCLNNIYLPKENGSSLFQRYRNAKGPGNIPKSQMYKYHTQFQNEPFDVVSMCEKEKENKDNKDNKEDNVGFLGTACYPEQGVPLAIYLMTKYDFDLSKALLANANAGGDCVHRGMMLGLILGCSIGDKPLEMINDNCKQLVTGLKNYQVLKKEIDTFVNACFE